MNHLTGRSGFSVPLTKEIYQTAEALSQEQHDPNKARQVYLNTLAVSAVGFYLKCLDVETTLDASDLSNPALRTLIDVSDLTIKDWGSLECRAVLPGDRICRVPSENQQDRMGYVVVEINQETNQAKLLGFAPAPVGDVLEIKQLAPLEQLINQFPEAETTESNVVNLLAWFKETFEVGWQSVRELVSPQLRPAFRDADAKQQERAKLIDLGLELSGHAVVLIITLQERDEETASVRAQVYPTGEANSLPPNLKLSVLTETGEVFQEVTARSNDEFIQYQLEMAWGDAFGIRVSLGEVCLTEQFQV